MEITMVEFMLGALQLIGIVVIIFTGFCLLIGAPFLIVGILAGTLCTLDFIFREIAFFFNPMTAYRNEHRDPPNCCYIPTKKIKNLDYISTERSKDCEFDSRRCQE